MLQTARSWIWKPRFCRPAESLDKHELYFGQVRVVSCRVPCMQQQAKTQMVALRCIALYCIASRYIASHVVL